MMSRPLSAVRITTAPNRPLSQVLSNHFFYYPTPSHLKYNWSFGSLVSLFCALPIVAGLFLVVYYTLHTEYAFEFVEHTMYDVNGGYLLSLLFETVHATPAVNTAFLNNVTITANPVFKLESPDTAHIDPAHIAILQDTINGKIGDLSEVPDKVLNGTHSALTSVSDANVKKSFAEGAQAIGNEISSRSRWYKPKVAGSPISVVVASTDFQVIEFPPTNRNKTSVIRVTDLLNGKNAELSKVSDAFFEKVKRAAAKNKDLTNHDTCKNAMTAIDNELYRRWRREMLINAAIIASFAAVAAFAYWYLGGFNGIAVPVTPPGASKQVPPEIPEIPQVPPQLVEATVSEADEFLAGVSYRQLNAYQRHVYSRTQPRNNAFEGYDAAREGYRDFKENCMHVLGPKMDERISFHAEWLYLNSAQRTEWRLRLDDRIDAEFINRAVKENTPAAREWLENFVDGRITYTYVGPDADLSAPETKERIAEMTGILQQPLEVKLDLLGYLEQATSSDNTTQSSLLLIIIFYAASQLVGFLYKKTRFGAAYKKREAALRARLREQYYIHNFAENSVKGTCSSARVGCNADE